jgi:protein phosphatase
MAEHPAVDCFGASHPGRQRESNEDRFLTAEIGRRMLVRQTTIQLAEGRRRFDALQGYLLVVADGMGGLPGGEYASELAVGAVANYVLSAMPCLRRSAVSPECGVDGELRRALQDCHTELLGFARQHPNYQGLGTTLTVALLLWPTLHVLHVGDSRCYLYRAGNLTRVTTDQNIAQDLVDSGLLTPETAAHSPWSRMLLNAVDDRPDALEPRMYEVALTAGDGIVLCTDGLTASLTETALTQILAKATTAQAACEALVQAANDAGGTDNITVVIARTAPPPG